MAPSMMSRVRQGRWLIVVVAAAELLLAGVALADRERIHFTAAGEKAAHAAVLTRADVGSAPEWTSRIRKPDLSSAPSCPGFRPKQSDLVVNGAAKVEWSRPGFDLDSEAEVLQTPAMVRLDWQRTVKEPQMLQCLSSLFQKQLLPSEKFVSISQLSFPTITAYTRAYRVLLDYTANGRTVRLAIDLVVVGKARTEITLTTTAPLAAGPAVKDTEIRLVRRLAARAT